MEDLVHTAVYRQGDLSDGIPSCETRDCIFRVREIERHVEFSFRIKAGGRGNSRIDLQVGLEDFRKILEELAYEVPESAEILASAAVIACTRLKENLKDELL